MGLILRYKVEPVKFGTPAFVTGLRVDSEKHAQTIKRRVLSCYTATTRAVLYSDFKLYEEIFFLKDL